MSKETREMIVGLAVTAARSAILWWIWNTLISANSNLPAITFLHAAGVIVLMKPFYTMKNNGG